MLVQDKMTRSVVTVAPDNTLKEALKFMKKGYNRLPVVKDGDLIGIIVKNDVEKALNRPGYYPETPVSWVMTKKVMTIGPQDDLLLAANTFIQYKISALPVIDEGNLVGIISDADILQAFIESMQAKT